MLKRAKLKYRLLEYRGFLLFVLLLGVFRGAIADWNPVPTGSMNPTIVEGDVIWVNKLAYNLKFPFTQHSLVEMADPERGDIVVFKSDKAKKRLVKRLIGLPGDIVSLSNNRLSVNGEMANYQPLAASQSRSDFTEVLANNAYSVRFDTNKHYPLRNLQPIRIPEGHYLMLGDNRDNSADSRVYGLVPHSELVGRASHVMASFDLKRFFIPRKERFFIPLI